MLPIAEFKTYREKSNINPNTIEMEIKYINKFHSFINKMKKDTVSVWDIKLKDVTMFFDEESKYLSDRTLYRKITIITTYYDYLWKKGYVPIDFMAKFRSNYRKLSWELPKVNIDYSIMLDKKEQILLDESIKLMPKLIYLLMLRGVALADMIGIELNDIIISDNMIQIIYVTKKNSTERTLTYNDPLEIGMLKKGIALAEHRNVRTLLSSKNNGEYGVFNTANLHDMVSPIEEILGFPIKSTHKVIYAYVNYLAKEQKKSVNEMSILLGMSITQTANLLKSALERVEDFSYNENVK